MRAVDGKQEIYLEWPKHEGQIVCCLCSSSLIGKTHPSGLAERN